MEKIMAGYKELYRVRRALKRSAEPDWRDQEVRALDELCDRLTAVLQPLDVEERAALLKGALARRLRLRLLSSGECMVVRVDVESGKVTAVPHSPRPSRKRKGNDDDDALAELMSGLSVGHKKRM